MLLTLQPSRPKYSSACGTTDRQRSGSSRQLERDHAAGAEAGDDVRTMRPAGADLRCEVLGQILDARQRLALVLEARRLEPVQRLLIAQVPGDVAVAEHVAVVSSHAKDGRAVPVRLQWYDGPRPLRERAGHAQEFQDIVLALLQPIAQLGR